jgi:FAD/FMN-containing dehydrogenase
VPVAVAAVEATVAALVFLDKAQTEVQEVVRAVADPVQFTAVALEQFMRQLAELNEVAVAVQYALFGQVLPGNSHPLMWVIFK